MKLFEIITLILGFSVVSVTAAPEYSFQCGSSVFICGGVSQDQVCNIPGANTYVAASPSECAGMIDATNHEATYDHVCPNGEVITSYAKYNGCRKTKGTLITMFELEQCSCPSGQCGSTTECGNGGTVGGDPHFRTHDGTMYSYHGECDLVMARSPSFGNGLGLDVHARTTIVAGWSLVSNAVVRIGHDVFEVKNDDTHYFNGVAALEFPLFLSEEYEINKEIKVLKNDEKTGKPITRTSWTIALTKKGEFVRISNFKSMMGVSVDADLPDTEGMLGSSKKAGLVGRDHKTIVSNPDAMGTHWQVNNTEAMLFQEVRSPQYPESCRLPKTNARRLSHSDAEQRLAEQACAYITEKALHDFCIQDVLLTGDASAADTFQSVF